jgi:hypothetical protein
MPAHRLTHTDYHRIGVEFKQVSKFFRGNVAVRFVAAPGQKGPGRAGLHCLPKKYLGAVLVQFFQQAAGPDTLKILQGVL